jgi:hypothetical protein
LTFRKRHISLILSLYLLIAQAVYGQSIHSKAEIKEMFPANTRDLWINYLSGTIEGGHTVDMILGTDGHTCKGLYTMRNSKITYYFEGNELNQQLRLVETDIDGKATGFFYGKYDGQTFEGLWMNKSKKLALKFHLDFVNSFYDFQPERCRYTQWLQFFSGKIHDKPVKLSIKRDQDIYTSELWHDGKKYKDAQPVIGESRITNLTFNGTNSILDNKSIVIDTQDLEKINISNLDEGSYETTQILRSERRMTFDCYEYADQTCRLKCVRPLLTHKNFDAWIEKKCQEWISGSKHDMTSNKISALNLGDRWSQTADSWVEIDLFLDDMISGRIYFQSSWRNGTVQQAFIYSLKDSRELTSKDLFSPDFDYTTFFNTEINVQKNEIHPNSQSVEWYKNQPFDKMTLKPDGFSFVSNFSTIHGEREILIPYISLADKIKNKSILKDLLLK